MVQLVLVVIYLAFISLGLPDSVLGAAWPSMYGELGVPVSYAGILSMIIAVGTVVSSLFSDWVNKKLGAGKVTALSVCMTAAALWGFSVSPAFWALCLWAVPYGLGAGSVDAALNNYVALHYESRQMSWLHCMWGVGTVIGPLIMGRVLTGGGAWNTGYLWISLLQIGLTVILVLSLPLWKKQTADKIGELPQKKAVSPFKAMKIPGAKEVMLTFFCYCALEQTAMLWASSYMVLHNQISPELAASYASILFIGITVGRLLSGFLTYRFSDTQMVRAGEGVLILGAVVLLLPLEIWVTMVGFVLIGLGCAPVYPCIIHATPTHFGAERSQAMIGIQMASAYVGTCLMPPLFGVIANHSTVGWLPAYLLAIAVLMLLAFERLLKKTV